MQTTTQQIEKNKSEKRNSALEAQKLYISMLENILVSISNNVRQHIDHIHGFPYIHETATDSPALLNKKILQMKQSALLLDNRTRELSVQIYKKIISLKAKKMN